MGYSNLNSSSYSQSGLAQSVYAALLDSPETIVFRSGFDGCWLNSHVACKIILRAGGLPGEVIIRPSNGHLQQPPFLLPAGSGDHPAVNFTWKEHVAATVSENGETTVIDPLLFEAPVSLPDFLGVFSNDVIVLPDFHGVFATDINFTTRSSINKTYAEDCFGKRPTLDYAKILYQRHCLGIKHIRLDQPTLSVPPSFDKERLGPTMGEFVRHSPYLRHHGPERPIRHSNLHAHAAIDAV